ncbi:MAG: hypothetical protein H7Y13_11855 [Sphingobacteriaceae bacterium]|nr:hypothetical protein [Sphingobacteriaceae bacterium]
MKKNKTVTAPAPVVEKPIADQVRGLQVIKSDQEVITEETDFQEVTEPQKKQVMNLDETLKVVEDLHRKKRQRDNLEYTSNLLDSFIIKRDEEDLDDKSYYQGCIISIKDDDNNEFKTKNPSIIGEVVKTLQRLFVEKLGEIEAQIVLPH